MAHKKKVILVCHDKVCPLVGAGGVRTIKIALGFSVKGFDVMIIAPTEEEKMYGLNIRGVYSLNNKKNILINLLKFNVSLFFQLVRNTRQADFFVVHNAISMPMVMAFARIFRKKVFLEVTDIHSEYVKMRLRIFSSRFIAYLLSLFEYKFISIADKVIAVTNQMKLDLESRGVDGKKIHVIYDGVDVDSFSIHKNKGSHNKIVHLGMVNVHNGVEYLVRSFVYVLKKNKDAVLYIVGEGMEMKKCKTIARELRIEKSVIFQNFETHDLMGEVLKDFSIGIIPRPDTRGNNLVITLKLLEYWASGTAVIASRLKGIEEIARDGYNILFTAAGNPDDLADKILALLENQNKKERLSLEGRNSVKSFSWEGAVSKTIDICLDKT